MLPITIVWTGELGYTPLAETVIEAVLLPTLMVLGR